MKQFLFPLQRVLDLRHTQLAIEDSRVQQQAAVLANLAQQRATALSAVLSAETEVRRNPTLAGRDLAALADFRQHLQSRQKQISRLLAECAETLASQQAVALETRRRCRLLERLKDRRLTEWKTARDKEVEELAADSYLAGWGRNPR